MFSYAVPGISKHCGACRICAIAQIRNYCREDEAESMNSDEQQLGAGAFGTACVGDAEVVLKTREQKALRPLYLS